MSCRCFAGCFFVCAIGIVGYAHAQTTQLWDSEIRKAASKEASVPPFLEQPFAPLLRDDKTLRMETLNAALPILLESQSRLQPALYLAARTAPGTAMPILERAFRESKDTRDKVGAAIAIRRFGRDAAAATLKKLAGMVEDKEAADWATVLSLDAEGGEIPAETRELDRGNSYFDEVIPLEISLDVFVPQEDGVVHSITLSPHDVRSVYGQAHACTNFNSRDSRLVIAKHLKLKDRLHVEGFLFKGMTFHPAEHRGVVNFLSESKRLLFLSGTILDRSAGTLEAEMRVVRAATWSAPTPRTWTGTAPVRFVSGDVSGWVYIDRQQLLDDDDEDGNPLDAGEVQLSSHTLVGEGKANGYFSGNFYGKISDVDGDGRVDLVPVTPLVNQDGFIDLDSNGVADEPLTTQTQTGVDPKLTER